MIKREHYIQKIRKFYDSDLIKVITGVKHSGKSVVLEQVMEEVKAKSDNVIYLNFGDKRVSSNIKNAEALVGYVESSEMHGKGYLFFDEIEILNGWQAACETLRKYGHSVFVVASDKESFNGSFFENCVSFTIRPFVYKEIAEYAKELYKSADIEDYIIWGGFPKRLELYGDDAKRRYLDELDSAIMNDLIRRHKIRKEGLFQSLVDFVLRSNGRIFSEKAIHDHITNEEGSCSINTIMKYIDFLENSYLVESMKQYSDKLSRELVFYTKLYNVDVAFNSVRCMDDRFDMARNFENIIYNELVYRGYDVSAYHNGNKKVDFLARADDKEYYIQAVYGDDRDASEAVSAFSGIGGSAKKLLITSGAVETSLNGVDQITFEEFLLTESLDEIDFKNSTENFFKETEARTENFFKETEARTENFSKKAKSDRRERAKVEKTEVTEEVSAPKQPEVKKKVPFYQIF